MTEDFKRKLTAVLSADVVGYSRLMGDDEAATVKTLEIYKGVMSSLIKQHRGRVVDSPGDNLLAEFGSVVDAVQCAVSIQKELQTRNAELPENRRMDFRIGINLGDVIEEEDRIYGDGVNIAARLEALADPGGICISKTAFDYIENKLPFGYSFIGEQTVKNIAKPVGAYKVLMETRVVDEEEGQKAKASFWRKRALLSIGIIVILAIVAVLYWNFYLRGPSIESASIEPEQETVATDVKEAPKTIAVLPFDDLSPNKDQEYFVLGLSEEILNRLAQIPDLTVIAKTSSFSFKGKDKTIQEIANVLNVGHILEGSVRKAGNTIRITAQLIKADDESHLWSKQYDKEFKVEEMFSVQEDIATAVADELRVTLEIDKPFKILGGTENSEAYELFLLVQGLRVRPGYFDLNNVEYQLESINKALVLDPEYANAWALKSMIHFSLTVLGPNDLFEMSRDEALNAAQKAIELDPNLSLGYIALNMSEKIRGNWINAELSYRKALELDAETLLHYAGPAEIYGILGYFKKSREILEKAKRKDPLNINTRAAYIGMLGLLKDAQGVEKENQHCEALFGDMWKLQSYSTAYHLLGTGFTVSSDEIDYSAPAFNAVKEHLDSPKEGLAVLHQLYNNEGTLGERDLTEIAMLAAYLGDPNFAMDAMEKGNKINAGGVIKIWYPVMKEVRQLPRFKEFVRKIGIVDYWKEYGWPDLCHPIGDDDFECD